MLNLFLHQNSIALQIKSGRHTGRQSYRRESFDFVLRLCAYYLGKAPANYGLRTDPFCQCLMLFEAAPFARSSMLDLFWPLIHCYHLDLNAICMKN